MASTELKPSWLTVPADNNELTKRIWPQDTTRDADGEVVFGGVPSSDLTAQFGTPLYVIDQTEFERNGLAVKESLEAAAERIGTSMDDLARVNPERFRQRRGVRHYDAG